MQQILPDAGLTEFLLRFTRDDLHYHLFSNNYTIVKGTTLGDLTELSGPSGYAVLTVVEADFTTAGVTGHIGSIQGAPISWTLGAYSITVYGYYITDTANAKLLGAANFDTPYNLASFGATIPVVPIFGDSSLYP